MALDNPAIKALGLSDLMGSSDAGDAGESVQVPGDPLAFADGASIAPNEDGTETVDFAPQGADAEPVAHDENLAEHMEESDLNTLANDLIDAVDVDLASRKDWEALLAEGITYLGLKIEERNYPFDQAAGVFDPILLEAVIRWHATASSELLPASGPVKTQVIGQSTDEIDAQAARVKEFMNFYLTEGAPEWVEQNDQMLFWLPLVGSTFKKTYQDPILNRVVSPFILPQNFVVSFSTDDLDTCTRATHIIDISAKDMKMRQLQGFYRDVELKEPDFTDENKTTLGQKSESTQGLTKPTDNDDAPYEMYEVHVDLDLVGFEHKAPVDGAEPGDDGTVDAADMEETGLPLPYIVTVETGSKKVLAIRRNWKEGDASYQKIQYFTHFKFVPGLGFYGLGYAHILGNSAKAVTSLQRQMIDAATLEMFPGGLRAKGSQRGDDNNRMIGPCEFVEIDTGGLPIQQVIMNMPYKGPSEVSMMLWDKSRENARGLGNMTEIAVGEGRQDAPVGTTVALMEAANRVQSATIKSAHRSYRREFKLIAALFGQFLPNEPYPWPVQGGPHVIMRADFSEQIDVIPVSDPNITSSAQRMMLAEAILRFATQAPALHDQYEAYKQMYTAMGLDQGKVDKILPAPKQAQPSDPLTENQNALTGKPLAVAEWQDHQAHIQAHQVLSDQVPSLAAHIAEHLAAAMRVNVQKTLGIQLPPMGTKLPPEIENKIAVLVAQALQQLNSPQGQEPSPGQIAMAQIQVEAKKVEVQLQDIQARSATAAFQATLKAKQAAADRASKEEIAMLNFHAAQQRTAEQERTKRSQRAYGTRSTF